jgi:hypothetical protein
MIFEFKLTAFVPQMHGATIECLHAQVDTELRNGSKLLDLSVDLSSSFAQDCPPISYYRIVLREPAWLRSLAVSPGKYCRLEEIIAVFSNAPDEDLSQPAVRPVRTTLAGIIYHEGMWTGRNP